MSPSFADLAPVLLVIIGLSLLMVFVMVQWSRALLSLRPDPAAQTAGLSPALRWGMTYALNLAALIAAFLSFLPQVGRTDLSSNLVLLLLAAAGWVAFNLLLVAFARAIQKANERDGAAAAGARGAKRRHQDKNWKGAVAREQPAPVRRGLRERLRSALLLARNIVLALLVIAIGEALPPLQELHAWVTAHDRAILSVVVPVGAVGFIVFMGCAIHLALAGNRPMSRAEIEELSQRARSGGPVLWRRFAYRTKGTALGAQGEDSASFAEVKAAWRARAWQASTRWRRMFLMMFASILMATGIVGTIFVFAPAGIKLLLGGAYLYAAVRITAGFVRA